jgi:transmembrane sensor
LSAKDEAQSDRQALIEEAASRFARLHSDAGVAERDAIASWIASDPRRAVAFAQLEAAWETAERLKGVRPGFDTGAVDDIDPGESAEPAVTDPGRRRLLVGGLAAAAVATLSAPIIYSQLRDHSRYITRRGERKTVALPDGSTLVLNTASQISVAFDKGQRLIRLFEGEALFDVAHDPSRPFVVAVNSTRFRAIGTAFNVRLRRDIVELTVTDGIVGVRDEDHGDTGDHGAQVVAGRGAVVRKGTIAVTPLDRELLDQRVAWRDGVIALDGDTIEQAVEEFNRYRDHPMVIGDPRIGSLRVGGRFEARESERFLAALQRSFPIRALPGADQSILLVYEE